MATSASLPTQELPFYLSASTFTVTTNGVVSTGVSTVNVPITYFGPSVSVFALLSGILHVEVDRERDLPFGVSPHMSWIRLIDDVGPKFVHLY